MKQSSNHVSANKSDNQINKFCLHDCPYVIQRHTADFRRPDTRYSDVFPMLTIVNSPAAVWALVYGPLITTAANIVQPDPSRTDTVSVVYLIADVPVCFGNNN